MEQNTPVKNQSPLLKQKRLARLRTAVQIFFFSIVGLLSLNKLLEEAGIDLPFLSSASLHSICPFGGVVSLYQLATEGNFIQKIHDSSLVVMSIVFLLAVLFGPVFCGWVCPLGSLQEWVGKLGARIFKKKYNHFIPQKVDRVLRYTRYVVLGWVVVITAVTTKLIFQDADPFYALFNFFTGEVSLLALTVLIATVIGSLFVERPWCKYLCPYGALLGIFNLFRIFKIRRSPSTCTHCSACDKACPMNISVSSGTAVHDHQCISCMKCTSDASCPVSDTVNFSAGGEKNG